jgi:hypothetical protein
MFLPYQPIPEHKPCPIIIDYHPVLAISLCPQYAYLANPTTLQEYEKKKR